MTTTRLTYGLTDISEAWPWQAVVAERLKLHTLSSPDTITTRRNEAALELPECLYWYLWRVDLAFGEAIMVSSVQTNQPTEPIVCCFDTGATVTKDSTGQPLIWSNSHPDAADLVGGSSLNWNESEVAFENWVTANYPDLLAYVRHEEPAASHCDILFSSEADSRWNSWEARIERATYMASAVIVDRLFLDHDEFDSMLRWLRQNVQLLNEDDVHAVIHYIRGQGSCDRPIVDAELHLTHACQEARP